MDLSRIFGKDTDEMLSVLSHEMNLPLQTMSMSLQVLQMQYANSQEISGHLQRMEKNLLRLQRFNDHFLGICKLAKENYLLHNEVLDLRELLLADQQLLQDLLPAMQKSLQVSLPDTPVLYRCDREVFERIVLNLLTNAVKHSGRHAQITLSLTVQDDRISLVVHNTESVLSDCMLQELTVANDPNAHHAHLGFGLLIVCRLSEMYNGTVSAKNLADGCEFRVDLPLSSDADELCMPIPTRSTDRMRLAEISVLFDMDDEVVL